MVPQRAPRTPASAQDGHHPGWGRRRVEAAVAALARQVHGRLAVEQQDRAVDQRLLEEDTRVVHQVARREVVRAVHDDVVVLDDVQRVLGVQRLLVRDRPSRPGCRRSASRCAETTLRLPTSSFWCRIWRCRFDRSTTSKSTRPMRADARQREVQRHGRAEAAGADDQHLASKILR